MWYLNEMEATLTEWNEWVWCVTLYITCIYLYICVYYVELQYVMLVRTHVSTIRACNESVGMNALRINEWKPRRDRMTSESPFLYLLYLVHATDLNMCNQLSRMYVHIIQLICFLTHTILCCIWIILIKYSKQFIWREKI